MPLVANIFDGIMKISISNKSSNKRRKKHKQLDHILSSIIYKPCAHSEFSALGSRPLSLQRAHRAFALEPNQARARQALIGATTRAFLSRYTHSLSLPLSALVCVRTRYFTPQTLHTQEGATAAHVVTPAVFGGRRFFLLFCPARYKRTHTQTHAVR